MAYIRLCPRCGSARPAEEMVCQGTFQQQTCQWFLLEVLPVPEESLAAEKAESEPAAEVTAQTAPGTENSAHAHAAPEAGSSTSTTPHCRNGHPMEAGDFMCMECGEGLAETVIAASPTVSSQPEIGSLVQTGSPESAAGGGDSAGSSGMGFLREVEGWRLIREMSVISGEADMYLAEPTPSESVAEAATMHEHGRQAVFRHYRPGVEPDPSLYPALRSLDRNHGVRLLDSGRLESRAYEVWEYLPLGSLGDLSADEKAEPEFVRGTVRETGAALHALAGVRLLHRDLKPASVLIRSRQPLDLVLAGFSTATVSEFELQISLTRQTTRYAAPETIAGTCAPASDWWSLGVMVLEMLTRGRGFTGVHDRAFLLHLVTRGLRVPDDLPEEWRELLMGLLARDPAQRWAWAEVQRWLAGERGIPHGYADDISGTGGGQGTAITLRLGENSWPTPESFALAAAEAKHWQEARDILLSGRLATWMDERSGGRGSGDRDRIRVAQIRRVAADLGLSEDARLSAVLLVLNPHLPLCLRGEIVTPGWALGHPELALAWIDSTLPDHLRRLGRETWLVRLRERADRVRMKIRDTSIGCDEAQLSAALLCISATVLQTRWQERRRMFPEAEIPALAALMERRQPSEEELIILNSASIDSFRPARDVVDEAIREARSAELPFAAALADQWLAFSRREVLDRLDERLRNFVRCGRSIPDSWADDFRLEHRIALSRAWILLSIPATEWKEPPRQEYVRNLLSFFHRKMLAGLQRGPLVRLTIGKTSSRLDLTELGGPARSSEELLTSVLSRRGKAVPLDPAPLLSVAKLEHRLRKLHKHTQDYYKDTGIQSLYLGFPFIAMRDARAGENTRPRIAPVLLWPVRLEVASGARGSIQLGFGRSSDSTEREEIRINPALEGLLGAAAPAWRQALEDLQGNEHLTLQSVLDALAALAPLSGDYGNAITVREEEVAEGDETPVSQRLSKLPPGDIRVAAGEIQLHAAAVIFHADFSGQTIAEDLKQLSSRPITGSALELVLRADDLQDNASSASASESPLPPVPTEADRYFTAASDPSQQAAVFAARQSPGLVVQGPPGTGKSQTIVNVVCDSIGRGERVLIVCQKPAALEVVRKRLEAEGLADRLFFVRDAKTDRRPIVEALRNQRDQPLMPTDEYDQLLAHREGIARQIESLEAQLNSAHQALRDVPAGRPGQLPYRAVLDKLMEIQRGPRPPVSHWGLGAFLKSMDYAAVEQLVEEVAPLSPLWLASGFEKSPLHALAQFRTDEAALGEFRRAFDALVAAEKNRRDLLRNHKLFFVKDMADPEPLRQWLAEHEPKLRQLPAAVIKSLSRWSSQFVSQSAHAPAPASHVAPWLNGLDERLSILSQWTLQPVVYEKLATRGNAPLERLAEYTRKVLDKPKSVFGWLNPGRWVARVRLNSWLRAAGADPDETDLQTLGNAIELEKSLRPERVALRQWREALGETASDKAESLPDLRKSLRQLSERVAPVTTAGRHLSACPSPEVSAALSRTTTVRDFNAALDACHSSIALWHAMRASESALASAEAWFDKSWIAERRTAIERTADNSAELDAVTGALPTLLPFQSFRIRAHAFGSQALPLLELLRAKEDTWRGFTNDAELCAELSRTVRSEALLAWKAAAEEACPSLLMAREEWTQRVQLLSERDETMRMANRHYLSRVAARAPIAKRTAWDDVLALRGARVRKLRELVERGESLGLFHLRPVWMVNPETASRLFPLRSGMFDVVIFDEASQMPVECALPSLYRAKRVVVSGDDKQMPPSRFFGSRLESDEDEDGAGLDNDDGDSSSEDAERERQAQAVGRREVKDSTDILSLSEGILPRNRLDIHYRSRYRQLIDFSNAAFYDGALNVPARHPEAEILRVRPLEVERVDGRYAAQMNEMEADRVVARLRDVWSAPQEQRPTIGVVTFNLRQADLIQEKLEELAEVDTAFRAAWEEEQGRSREGEDMSIFVKNLENVQGDERDWILFSTTFGRDAAGRFRRNFGVLGQTGGERRLNVAVTRAREKIVVFTSMPVDDVSDWLRGHSRRAPDKPRDYLQGWLAFAERVSSGNMKEAGTLLDAINTNGAGAKARSSASEAGSEVVRQGRSVTSAFVDEVADFLRSLGYEPVAAGGDAFGVDYALVDPATGHFALGIECDSPHHSVLNSARARELWRPSVLRTIIPALHRVSSRAWYHSRAEEEARLRTAVQSAFSHQSMSIVALPTSL